MKGSQIFSTECVKCGRRFEFSVPLSKNKPQYPRRFCQICRCRRVKK